MLAVRFHAEFVVTTSKILDERVTADDHRRGPISSQTAHRSQPRFEAAVVVLDPTIRILVGVMQRFGDQLIYNAQQWCCQVVVTSTGRPWSLNAVLKK